MHLNRRDKILITAALLWLFFAGAGYLWYSHANQQPAADDGNYSPYRVTTTVGPEGPVKISYYHDDGMVCTQPPIPQGITCTSGDG